VKILVTGASGFIGGEVVRALLASAPQVRIRALSRSAGADVRLPGGVEAVRGDLTTPDRLAEACSDVDVVVHCAGVTRARSIEEFYYVNAEGASHVARAAHAAGVKRFVLLSSLAARGPDATPSSGGTASNLGPVEPYGRSKLAGERAVAKVASDGWSVALQPGAVYGPGDRELLPLIRLAKRGVAVVPAATHARIQPVYVSDLAELVVRTALELPELPFGPWPVAHDQATPWREVGDLLAVAFHPHTVRTLALPAIAFEAVAAASELYALVSGTAPTVDLRRARDLARRSYTTDMTPTRAATGWRAKTDLREGIRITVAGYEQRGWL